ncbi:cytochrome P450 [Epithele typhae]|uniref:cytochrome P450 n=1 Tax=Epithele typhae TaxID=378194 RepID=UPI00200866D0|nr:cytochrome P450 [Epithele typhae]KAH9939661.1 cytochrome P450 [Epithele typhae]
MPRLDHSLSILPFVVIGVLWLLRSRNSKRKPLPPGPRPLPFIGNFLDVPHKNRPAVYRDLNDKYGDVVYLDVLGQPTVILGSHAAAVDLLEKRSSIYSTRRVPPMAEISGFDWFFVMSPYGDRWRRTRRAFHEFMHAHAVPRHHHVMDAEVRKYLLCLLDDPARYRDHTTQLFSAVVLRVTYGLDVHAPGGAEYVQTVADAQKAIGEAFRFGKYPLAQVPLLRHLPGWVPGMGFKHECEGWRSAARRTLEVPWEAAQKAARGGNTGPSMASFLMEREEQCGGEEVAKAVAASVYAGGSETSTATLDVFYLAMASHPEAQVRAQRELEAVVGSDRLPTASDRHNLPYVTAVMKEVMRWKPVVPLGVAHRSVEEDEYMGYHIPKGTGVIIYVLEVLVKLDV